jgi:hypothetical protein
MTQDKGGMFEGTARDRLSAQLGIGHVSHQILGVHQIVLVYDPGKINMDATLLSGLPFRCP